MYVKLGFGILVAAALVFVGVHILSQKDDNIRMIDATVESPVVCKETPCSISVSYTYNNAQQHSVVQGHENTTYSAQSTVPIYIDITSPDVNPSLDKPDSKWIGGGLIIGAVVGMTLLSVWFWLTRKYKVVAAAEGTSDLLSFVSGGKI